jgi:predicted nuclease of restriction endonuclease-like (RecB) superfamily
MRAEDLPSDYPDLLDDLKNRVRTALSQVARSVNRAVIELYWQIGRAVVQRQEFENWDEAVIEELALDLQSEFPGMRGFSRVNLARVRSFFLAYTHDYVGTAPPCHEIDGIKPPGVLAELPWRHNVALVEQLRDPTERLWYAQTAVDRGWSLDTLRTQIGEALYEQEGESGGAVPPALASAAQELVRHILTEPDNCEFLRLQEKPPQRAREDRLLRHSRRYLLGQGGRFALLGSPYSLATSKGEVQVDQLFYQLRLRRFVALSMEYSPFRDASQARMLEWLANIDQALRRGDDGGSVGIIVNLHRDSVAVRFAWGNEVKQVGSDLPAEFEGEIPSGEDWETELQLASLL